MLRILKILIYWWIKSIDQQSLEHAIAVERYFSEATADALVTVEIFG